MKITQKENKFWMVVKVKTRCEKQYAKFCEIKNITHYLPLRKSIKKYMRSKAEFNVPVFPGYVFVQSEPTNKVFLLEGSKGIHIIIPEPSYDAQFVEELKAIQQLLNAQNAGKVVMRPEIVEGSTVAVKNGPLAGLSGIVKNRKNKIKLTVNVELIGHSVTLEVDVDDVEIV